MFRGPDKTTPFYDNPAMEQDESQAHKMEEAHNPNILRIRADLNHRGSLKSMTRSQQLRDEAKPRFVQT